MPSSRIVFIDAFDSASRDARETLAEPDQRQVLIATRWEKRLQKVVVAKFSVVIPTSEIEWEAIPTFDQWVEIDEEEARKKEEDALKEKERLAREEAELQALPGLYCTECKRWQPEQSLEGPCDRCRRLLTYDPEQRQYRTLVKGIFGVKSRTARDKDVERVKRQHLSPSKK